jgi:hypothetical protein
MVGARVVRWAAKKADWTADRMAAMTVDRLGDLSVVMMVGYSAGK